VTPQVCWPCALPPSKSGHALLRCGVLSVCYVLGVISFCVVQLSSVAHMCYNRSVSHCDQLFPTSTHQSTFCTTFQLPSCLFCRSSNYSCFNYTTLYVDRRCSRDFYNVVTEMVNCIDHGKGLRVCFSSFTRTNYPHLEMQPLLCQKYSGIGYRYVCYSISFIVQCIAIS